MNNKIIFHIDVNSAFLSWEAIHRMKMGEKLDLRTVPSIVGGDPKSRRGVVLAKSYPCKPYGIRTGESVYSALKKCKDLVIVKPTFDVYDKASDEMYKLVCEYSDIVHRASVDEVFLDYTHMVSYFGDPIKTADIIRERIKSELGFTVCIGISSNKLLAKMATELRKPDFTNTLFPDEIEKMWQLPIEELLMVGKATAPKIRRLGINTIGDLAKTDLKVLRAYFKSYGDILWQYANGLESSEIRTKERQAKGIGNSTTLSENIVSRDEANIVLLYLCEKVGMRLRAHGFLTGSISVGIRTSKFENYSHQKKIYNPTDSTSELFKYTKELFQESWKGEPIRHLSIRATDLSDPAVQQLTLFDLEETNGRSTAGGSGFSKGKTTDKMVDEIRAKYGKKSILRASELTRFKKKP